MSTTFEDAIKAAQEQARAELLAAQAAEKAAASSAEQVRTNRELIGKVALLLDRVSQAVEQWDALEAIPEQLRQLTETLRLLIAIVAKSHKGDEDEVKALQDRIHELAMATATKGVQVTQQSGTQIGIEGDVRDSALGETASLKKKGNG